MDCTVNKTDVLSTAIAFDDFFEEKIEFDIVIPDYSPAAMRILGCDVVPAILARTADGERVKLDVQCRACVIYTDGDNGCIRSVEKTETFSRTVSLTTELAACRIRTGLRPISVNCRLANPRRISVKSVIGTALKIIGNTVVPVVSETDCLEAQYKNISANIFAGAGDATSRISGSVTAAPGITDIITTFGSIDVSDVKTISDKVIIKGDADISIVYMTGEGTDDLHFERCRIPFSDIIDVDNATESSMSDVSATVTDIRCDIVGDSGEIALDVEALISASVYSPVEMRLMHDAYSMNCEPSMGRSRITVESLYERSRFSDTVTGSVPADISDARIIGVTADPVIKSISLRDGMLSIDGDMYAKIYMCNTEEYRISDKSVPFSFSRPLPEAGGNIRCEANAILKKITFSMPDDNTVTLTADVDVELNCFSADTYSVIDSVEYGDETPEMCKGVILYYADKDETLWDIAKKYRSSVDIIKRDNALDDDVLDKSKMLLIAFN